MRTYPTARPGAFTSICRTVGTALFVFYFLIKGPHPAPGQDTDGRRSRITDILLASACRSLHFVSTRPTSAAGLGIIALLCPYNFLQS
jgi:hypothetical protein